MAHTEKHVLIMKYRQKSNSIFSKAGMGVNQQARQHRQIFTCCQTLT